MTFDASNLSPAQQRAVKSIRQSAVILCMNMDDMSITYNSSTLAALRRKGALEDFRLPPPMDYGVASRLTLPALAWAKDQANDG